MTGIRTSGEHPPQRAQLGPKFCARVRQPQVQVVVGSERTQQLDVGGRKPGVSEQRDPRGQIGRVVPQRFDGFPMAQMRRIDAHRLHQRPPKMRLPCQIVVDAAGTSFEPVDE